MTTAIRFVGDLPVWIGLSLSLVVGILSWRYYRRESFDLPGRLKWGLPLLRTMAFMLSVIILLGPVLHHRRVIGELGQVKIYVDGSQSMTLHDRQMTIGRKLKIAEQLGWLDADENDFDQFEAFDRLAELHGRLQVTRTEEVLQQLLQLQTAMPTSIQQLLTGRLVDPFKESAAEFSPEQQQAFSAAFDSLLKELEQEMRKEVFIRPNWAEAISRFDTTTRWQRLSEMVSPELVSQLRERHNVEIFSLQGKEARSVEGELLTEKDEFAVFTDLTTGITSTQKEVVDAEPKTSSKTKSVVVMFTDGQHNSGPSPSQSARVLGKQESPVYCVAFGAESSAPDLAVLSLQYPEIVFQKDKVYGVMSVRDRVSIGTPFVAQVRYRNEVLWQQEFVSTGAAERQIEFEFEIDELVAQVKSQPSLGVVQHAMPLELEASVSVLPEESETANNSQKIRIAAMTERNKVLLLDGRSRWETRYLRNVFERDEQWDVDTVIAGPGTSSTTLPRGEENDQFPMSRDALFDYDLIIWGEIDLEIFQNAELSWLREFVEIRGGGWIFIDGNRRKVSTLVDSELGPMLPVEWSSAQANPAQALSLTEFGKQLPVLRLATDAERNQHLWSELPAPHSLASVSALPGTQTWVECLVRNEHVPFMVSRQFGAGRVLYLASDETWRWRFKVADLWHQRFWNQLAKYVMPPPFAVSDEYVSIDTGPVSYEFGEAIDIRIRLLGLDGRPAEQALVDALVWKDGREVGHVSLAADESLPGIYRGQLGRLSPGAYEVSVQAAGFSESALKARTELTILPIETDEMTQTEVNVELLQQMATVSEGIYLPEEDFGKLPELLDPFSDGRVVESETLIWQSYWWFSAIVLLLTIEWILRKRAGLL